MHVCACGDCETAPFDDTCKFEQRVEQLEAMLWRVLESWPYQPPEVVNPERERFLAYLNAPATA